MSGGRPRRPAAEAQFVREAAAEMERTISAEALARVIATRVVDELAKYIEEGGDPILGAAGELRRYTSPTPYSMLAVDPSVSTIDLYVDQAVQRLRARQGRLLSPRDAATEVASLLGLVRKTLKSRYLRYLR